MKFPWGEGGFELHKESQTKGMFSDAERLSLVRLGLNVAQPDNPRETEMARSGAAVFEG